MDGWVGGAGVGGCWIDGWGGGWVGGWVDVGSVGRWVSSGGENKSMDRWMDEWVVGWLCLPRLS